MSSVDSVVALSLGGLLAEKISGVKCALRAFVVAKVKPGGAQGVYWEEKEAMVCA